VIAATKLIHPIQFAPSIHSITTCRDMKVNLDNLTAEGNLDSNVV
jgi:hypothetical protein